jgi:predicted Rossmann-fold nucleotide-binding protein
MGEFFYLFLSLALGRALATLGRPLVYGGGAQGIMGIISGAVLSHGGSVTAVVPSAMLRVGEGDQTTGGHVDLAEEGHHTVQTLLRHAAYRLTL